MIHYFLLTSGIEIYGRSKGTTNYQPGTNLNIEVSNPLIVPVVDTVRTTLDHYLEHPMDNETIKINLLHVAAIMSYDDDETPTFTPNPPQP